MNSPPSHVNKGCPPERAWDDLVLGLTRKAEALTLMQHATSCPECANALRAAIQVFAPEASALETHGTPVPRKRTRTTLRSPWVLVPTGLALSILAVAVIIKVREDRVPKLLAQAYTQHRPFEFRLPGTAYGPVRIRRSAQGSALEKPPSLLDAESILSRQGSNPKYHKWVGIADLLESDPASAVESLERAHRDAPSDVEVSVDLAIARAALAESANRPSGYGVAFDLLSGAQQKRPGDPVIAFNMALLCNRLKLYTEAQRQWKSYLKLDPDSPWSQEAKEHLKEVEAILDRRSQMRHALEAGDQAYLKLASSLRSDLSEYLEIQAIEWLARVGDPLTDRALSSLAAELQTKFGDRWLEDARQEVVNHAHVVALLNLIRSNEKGDPDAVIEAYPGVIGQFANSPALKARARYEIAFAFTRATRFPECVAQSAPLAREISSSYRWLALQNRLGLAICESGTGNEGDSIQAMAHVASDAQQAGFDNLYIRAFVNREATHNMAGDPWLDWPEFLSNIDLCWRSNISPKLLHLLYFNLGLSAEQARLFNTAFELASSGAEQYELVGNTTTEALIDESAGAIGLEAARPAEAEWLFERARKLFSALPDSDTSKRYLWEANLELAQAKLENDDVSGAARLIPELDRNELTTENASAIQFWKELLLGRIALASSDSPRAATHLHKAIDLARDRMSSQNSLPLWQRADSDLYAAVQSYVEYLVTMQRDPSAAIKAWIELTSGHVWPHSQAEAWLVFLVLHGRIAAWLADASGIEFHWLEIRPEAAQSLNSRLFDHLQSPDNNPDDVQNLSRQLFDQFLAPFATRLSHERSLKIGTGAELNAVAFDLALSGGPSPIRDLPIVICRKFETEASVTRINRSTRALIVAAGIPPPTRHFPVLEDAEAEARDVAAAFEAPAIMSGAEAVSQRLAAECPRAELFHFVGHAYGGVSPGAIVLADADVPAATIMRTDWRSARLVVLSACLTGDIELGGQPNPDGLVRAFLVAGAHAVVASRWRVDSAATRQFMRAFYQQLNSSSDPATALIWARSSLRAEAAYRHPFYWGAFQVYE